MTRPTDVPEGFWEKQEEGFEQSKGTTEQKLILMLNPGQEDFFKELWVSGCWIAYELKKLDASAEDIMDFQFANGQRATTCVGDLEKLWEFAKESVERYKAGQKEKSPDELAEELAPETLKNMGDKELAAYASEITGEEVSEDFIALAKDRAQEFGFEFKVGDEVVVPGKKDYN